MKKFLHISSDVPGTLKIDDDNILIGDKKVHLLADGNVYVEFSPTNGKLEDNINLLIPQQSSNMVQTIPYTFNHYDIHIMPVLNYDKLSPVYSITFGKIKIMCFESNKTITKVYLDNDLKQTIYSPVLQQVHASTNSFVFIKGKCADKQYVIVLDENFNVILNNLCEYVEEIDNHIKILINTYDTCGHGKVYNFDTKGNVFDTFYVYMHNSPLECNDDRLLPMYMFDSIICGNYTLTKHCFQDDIDTQKLLDYFGTIREYYYNAYDENNINYTVFADTVKSYDFKIDSHKITDIEEVQLNI